MRSGKMKRVSKRILGMALAVMLALPNMGIKTSAHILKRDAKSGEEEEYAKYSDIKDYLVGEGILAENDLIVSDSSVDLSQSACFPEIESQVGGTCAAFASVYYQYSYEANRALGVTSKEE